MKLLVGIFVTIFIVGVISIDDDDESYPKKPPKSLIYECALEYNINKAKLADIATSKTFSKTENTQCFASCLMNESGILMNGEKNEDFVQSKAGKECQDWSGENNCEIASNMLNCLLQKGFIALN